MRGRKLGSLSSLFGAAIKSASKRTDSNSTPDLLNLKELVLTGNSSKKSSKTLTRTAASRLNPSDSENLRESAGASSGSDSAIQLLREISSILCGRNVSESPILPPCEVSDNEKSQENVLDIPWFSTVSNTCVSQRRKELSRERKQKWIFKNAQVRRFDKLVRMCAQKLGTEATLEVFGKLGRETGAKEYNALIKLCMESARGSYDEEDSWDQIHKAFQILRSMREQGFELEEESYGPFIMYLVDMGMVQEFHFLSKFIKDENPGSFFRLGYYEMLLWIRVNDDDKVQELCNLVGVDISEDSYNLAENYLLALCENDRKEILQLLEVVDITKISSLDYVASIFKSLGRLVLESFAEKFILAFKTSEAGEENISSFIYNYAISIPNLTVEEVVSKFKSLHVKLEMLPSSKSYDNLITYCCGSLKVHAALDIVDQMCQSGLELSIETFDPILLASEQSCEPDLVRPIYSVMRRHNLKPKGETFRSMINLCVRMKDFEGAYSLLTDLEEMNMIPTANMYNAIMAGYFREKNFHGGLMVLKQMEHADVKPDSKTFSYLIANCESEDDINKYWEELKNSGVQVTKHVYMALINAYANCGQFDAAKQVILNQGILVKNLNEIKSVLVSALASKGQILDALKIYEEIQQAGCSLEPKAIISLIEHLRSEGELNKLFQLLGELKDLGSWFDGCGRVVLYCVRHKYLSSAIDLLKQLKEKDESVAYSVFDKVFSQIYDTEPTDLDLGLDLLRAIKEKLDLRPSRTVLDFLLSACASAKDPHRAQLIWAEYQQADLSLNVLTFLRMYQTLLASGEHNSAKKMLKKIQKDDPHVRSIIKACDAAYSSNSKPVVGKKTKPLKAKKPKYRKAKKE